MKDRRRSPRLAVSDQIHARLGGSDVPVRVLDISFGGCLLETDAPLRVGSLKELHFFTPQGASVCIVTARVAHSRGEAGSCYSTGFSFVGPRGPSGAAEFDRLIDAVMGVLSTD